MDEDEDMTDTAEDENVIDTYEDINEIEAEAAFDEGSMDGGSGCED